MPNPSRALKLKTSTILLRDPDAIEIIVARSKRERRSKSAAMAVIILEWAKLKSLFRRHRDRTSCHCQSSNLKPETTTLKDNFENVCGQVENPPADSAAKTSDAAAVDPVEKAAGNGD